MNQRAVSAAGRELLSEEDALRVYEEIERAKNRAFYVGQYLGLHVAEVESICTQEKEARDQLYKVLLQTAREAKLTWERVAVALRQPLVALPLVAQRIEETHCRGSSVPTLPRTAPEQSTEHQRATELEQMSVRQQRQPGLHGHPELDSKDKYGETDLLFACKENDLRVVEKILHKGADPNIPNLDEEVPLVAAAGCGNTEMVEELLRAGADPNPNLTTLKSPLSVAAQSGNLKMVTELLHAGANPNYFTDKGTPLANAAKLGNIEMVQYMLSAGADTNIAEYADQLPLHHARRLDNKQMIQLLIDYGADPEKEAKLPGKVAQLALRISKGTSSQLAHYAVSMKSS